jgi:hypothetical protein
MFNRKQIIAALAKETPKRRSLTEFKATMLSEHVALVTYRARRHPKGRASAVTTLRSSIWRRSNGQWQMVFHQGTLAA